MSNGDKYFRKALNLAQSISDDVDVPWLAEIIREVESDTIDLCVKIVNGFASGHHFAGDMAGEKSFRRCIEALQATKD